MFLGKEILDLALTNFEILTIGITVAIIVFIIIISKDYKKE